MRGELERCATPAELDVGVVELGLGHERRPCDEPERVPEVGELEHATQALVAKDGMRALASQLDWLGSSGAELRQSRQVVWETDPSARGGYAYFDPAFDPALRQWLARPFGRLFFAGEHTSFQWQGYMNGAVESGRRAAAEIEAVHRV